MIILHDILTNRVFFKFSVNFKCIIKVHLPHCRTSNEDIHVIVDYCSGVLGLNLSKSNISDVIFRHLTKNDKNKMAIPVTWAIGS